MTNDGEIHFTNKLHVYTYYASFYYSISMKYTELQ